MPKSISILGVGNRLFGDDGAGSITVDVLKECLEVRDSSVNLFVFETLDTSLISLLEESDVVVFVDAILGVNEPKLYTVDPESAKDEALEAVRLVDPHYLDPARLVSLAYITGRLKARVYLVGIPAKSLELGAGLSRETLQAIPIAIKLILKLLEHELKTPPRIDWGCVETKLALLKSSPSNRYST